MKLNEGINDQWIFKAIFLIGGPGCLAKGTEVVTFDGSLKKVENLKENDLLMGSNSKPRKILRLVKGIDNLYKVIQSKNNEYTVNESHVLSLKKSIRAIKSGRYKDFDEMVDISVKDYLKKSNRWKRNFYGWRTDIIFQPREVKIDPYYLGLWLGDGNKHKPSITSMDMEVENYLKEYAEELDLCISITGNKKAKNINITSGRNKKENSLTSLLKYYSLINNKHVPDDYIYNSKNVRYNLLAGLIDSDGSLDGNCFDIFQKNERLSKQIAYLVNSLGMRCNLRKQWRTNTNTNKGDWYWRISISGNTHKIPTRLPHKKVTKYNKRVDPSICSIEIKPAGVGEYFGFELDGDGLFLLRDFTVTHNSGKSFFKKKLFPNFKNINPDTLREFLAKKEKLPFDQRSMTPEQEKKQKEIHVKGKEGTKGQRKNFVTGRLPIVSDTTGRDANFIKSQKASLEKLGYETKLVFVKTTLEKALERNLSRERKLKPKEVEDMHGQVKANISEYKQLFGSDYIEVDNTRPYEETKPEWNILWKKIATWMDKEVGNNEAKAWKQEQLNKKQSTRDRIKDLSK